MKISDTVKFFFQYLLSPLILLGLGYIINSNAEQQKQALQKIQITEDIVKNVFDGNSAKAFTLVGLLPTLIDDKNLTDSITVKVKIYYSNAASAAAKNGEADKVLEIQNAAVVGLNTTDSKSFVETMSKDENVKKVNVAKQFEQKGFTDLFIHKDFAGAEKAFLKVDSVYPTYHSAYEISRLIKTHQSALNDPARREVTKVMLLDSIKSRYYSIAK